jgi:hypothetical protein
LFQRTIVLSAEAVRSWVGEIERTDQTVCECALSVWTCWNVDDHTIAVLIYGWQTRSVTDGSDVA